IQFAAGAKLVKTVHRDATPARNMAQAREIVEQLPLERYRALLGSAHVMGGCPMGEDPQHAVTDSLGRHHQLENLSIHDGSLFPTSLDANPPLSIYGLSAKLASLLVVRPAEPCLPRAPLRSATTEHNKLHPPPFMPRLGLRGGLAAQSQPGEPATARAIAAV